MFVHECLVRKSPWLYEGPVCVHWSPNKLCFSPNVTWVGIAALYFFLLMFIFLTFKCILEDMSVNLPARRDVLRELCL